MNTKPTKRRFTEQEDQQLTTLALKSGMSKTDYLRALVREQHMQLVQAGFLEPVSVEEHALVRRLRPYSSTLKSIEEPLS